MKIGRHLLQTHPDNLLRGVLWQDQRENPLSRSVAQVVTYHRQCPSTSNRGSTQRTPETPGRVVKPEGQAQWPIPHTEREPMDMCRSQDQISVRLSPATSDETLVAVAKLGDRSAFAELWNRHSRTAFKKVYQIMKNEADAEDVIQEAWMKAFIHLDKFDGRAKFSTWLARIAINSALM